MANFAAVVDADGERRRRFLEAAREAVAILPGLRRGELELGTFAATWAASPRAPVSVHSDAGRAAAVWGDAYLGASASRAGARDVADAWLGRAPAPPMAGFHAAITFEQPGRLVAGCDILGFFPLYHWTSADGAVVVTSSAALFRHHPGFLARPSVQGLAGVLLTGGLVKGRSPWEGVRRLAAGHLVRLEPGSVAKETRQYRMPPPAKSQSGVAASEAARIEPVLRHAMGRQGARERRHVLLLSGGRDSRVIAAHLTACGAHFRALSLGLRTDYEVDFGRRVARAIGVAHEVAEVPLERFGELAKTHIQAEHLHAHLAGLHNWGIVDLFASTDAAVVCGHALELALGGIRLHEPHGPESAATPLEAYWKRIGERAIPRALLTGLVRDDTLAEAIEDARRDVEADLGGSGGWNEALLEYARHHPGAILWRLSFGAWPVTPILDPEVLRAGAVTFDPAFEEREIQDEMLRQFHPRLARLPLDRPDGTIRPIVSDARWRISRSADRLLTRLGIAEDGPRNHKRRYRRIYDLDNVGWRQVRSLAEPFRHLTHEWFHEKALRDYLPPPDRPLTLERPIPDGYGRKLLLAVMLWAGLT